MVQILANMEDDDNGATRPTGRRKRRVGGEDEPEQLSTVPEGVECNPMAPTKRHKTDRVQSSQAPALLPLEPICPAQLPPRPSQPRQTTTRYHQRHHDEDEDSMAGIDANIGKDIPVDHDDDDIYASPAPPPRRRLYKKYVPDSDSDNQPQQPETLHPEGKILVLLIDILLMCSL